jgi:hypothetical protein
VGSTKQKKGKRAAETKVLDYDKPSPAKGGQKGGEIYMKKVKR